MTRIRAFCGALTIFHGLLCVAAIGSPGAVWSTPLLALICAYWAFFSLWEKP